MREGSQGILFLFLFFRHTNPYFGIVHGHESRMSFSWEKLEAKSSNSGLELGCIYEEDYLT